MTVAAILKFHAERDNLHGCSRRARTVRCLSPCVRYADRATRDEETPNTMTAARISSQLWRLNVASERRFEVSLKGTTIEGSPELRTRLDELSESGAIRSWNRNTSGNVELVVAPMRARTVRRALTAIEGVTAVHYRGFSGEVELF